MVRVGHNYLVIIAGKPAKYIFLKKSLDLLLRQLKTRKIVAVMDAALAITKMKRKRISHVHLHSITVYLYVTNSQRDQITVVLIAQLVEHCNPVQA